MIKRFTSMFQKFRFVGFGGIYFEKVLGWQRGIGNARFGGIGRTATRLREIQWTRKGYEKKRSMGRGIEESRVGGWEEYYKEHYHHPDGERMIGGWKVNNSEVIGNRYRVEDRRDFRRGWNRQMDKEAKMKMGKELESYVNSGYTNHTIIEMEYFGIITIGVWRGVMVHNWVTFRMISEDEEFVRRYYSGNLLFWWPFAHWVFCYWVIIVMSTDTRDGNPEKDDEFYIETSCAHEWENIVEEVEMELEERDEVNNMVGWSMVPSHIRECVGPDDMDRSKAEGWVGKEYRKEEGWGKRNGKDMIKKRKSIIGVSGRKERAWYDWTSEESDRLYEEDRDRYEEWIRIREEEMRMYNEEWIDDRRYNRDGQNIEESDEFEQEDNCPKRELENDIGARIEWTKESWERRAATIMTRRWSWDRRGDMRGKSRNARREGDGKGGMKEEYRRDRYGKSKNEENKEKIIRWLMEAGKRRRNWVKRRREEYNKERGREAGIKRGRERKVRGKSGGDEEKGRLGRWLERGKKRREREGKREMIGDVNTESMEKKWNKKDGWVDTKTLEKMSVEYNIYMYEKYKKREKVWKEKKNRWKRKKENRVTKEWEEGRKRRWKRVREGGGKWEEMRKWQGWGVKEKRREEVGGEQIWKKNRRKRIIREMKIRDNEWMGGIIWYGILVKRKKGKKGQRWRWKASAKRWKKIIEITRGGIKRINKYRERRDWKGGTKRRKREGGKWEEWTRDRERWREKRKGEKGIVWKRGEMEIGERWWKEYWWKIEELRKKRVAELEVKRVVKGHYYELDRKRGGKTIKKVNENEVGKKRLEFLTEIEGKKRKSKLERWKETYKKYKKKILMKKNQLIKEGKSKRRREKRKKWMIEEKLKEKKKREKKRGNK